MHPLTRRRLLVRVVGLPGLAAVATATTSCTSETPAPPADPDRVAVELALGVETALLDAVTAWDVAGPARQSLFGVVTAHIDALQMALAAPSALPAPTTPAPTTTPVIATDSVRRAADDAADQHTRAVRTASAGITPLLASLAASDAAMAAWLRGAGPGISQ